MERRTYLRVLGGGLPVALSGCLADSTLAAADGETTFTVCGPASVDACGERSPRVALAEADGTDRVDGEEGDATALVASGPTTLTVVGRTHGIGDPDCRETTLASAVVEEGTLTVVIRDRTVSPGSGGGCYETREPNYYRLGVETADTTVSRVHVEHRDEETTRFDATFDLSGATETRTGTATGRTETD